MKKTKQQARMQLAEQRRHELFVNSNPYKAVLKFSWPLIIALLTYSLYILLDRAFATNFIHYLPSQIPAEYNNNSAAVIRVAIQLAFPFYNLYLGLAIIFPAGVSAVYLQLTKKVHHQKQAKTDYLANLMYFLLIYSLVVAGILFLIAYIYIFFIAKVAAFVAQQALLFLVPFALAMPFWCFANLFSSVLRCEGYAIFTGVLTILVCAINVFFDWLFLVVLHYGLWFSAWSTFIGYVFQFGLGLIVLALYYPFLFKGLWHKPPFNFRLIMRTGGLGFAPFVTRICQFVITTTLPFFMLVLPFHPEQGTHISNDFAYWNSFYSITLTVFYFFNFLTIAVRICSKVICSYNRTLHNHDRINEILKSVWVVSLIYLFIVMGFCIGMTRYIFYLFNDHNEMQISLGYQFMALCFVGYFAWSFLSYALIFYQINLKSFFAFFITILPWVLFFVGFGLASLLSLWIATPVWFFASFGLGQILSVLIILPIIEKAVKKIYHPNKQLVAV